MRIKIPIDQYESKLHGRVFGVFAVAMLVVSIIAWFIDALYGQDWHGQLIGYFDSFWPKAAAEARLMSENRMAGLVGPYLLAQATFTGFMIFVTVWCILKMRNEADFSAPEKFILQPGSLFLAPIVIGVIFGFVYFYELSEPTSYAGRITRSPILFLWLPLCYAAASIVCIQIAAAYFVHSERKKTDT